MFPKGFLLNVLIFNPARMDNLIYKTQAEDIKTSPKTGSNWLENNSTYSFLHTQICTIIHQMCPQILATFHKNISIQILVYH